MPQSLARVTIHIVFSTKNRDRSLRDATLRKELYAYMATILSGNVDSPALLLNGVEDHIHGFSGTPHTPQYFNRRALRLGL